MRLLLRPRLRPRHCVLLRLLFQIAAVSSFAQDAAEGVFNSGISAFQQGHFEESVGFFLQAAELDPVYKMLSFSNIATVQELLGDVSGALSYSLLAIESATAEEPVTPSLLVKTAIQCGKLSRTEEAERFLKWALQLDPHYGGAKQNLAVLYERTRRFEASISIWREMIASDPNFEPRFYYNLGLVAQNAGRFLESEEAFLEYTMLNPDDPEGWYNLGSLRRTGRMGKDRVDQMRDALLHTVELNPDHHAAYAVLGGGLVDEKVLASHVPPPAQRYTEGVMYLTLALRMLDEKNYTDVYSEANMVLGKSWSLDWENFVEATDRLARSIKSNCATGGAIPAPAHMLMIIPMELESYRCWIDAWANETVGKLHNTTRLSPLYLAPYDGGRLKLAYVSGMGFQKSPGTAAIRAIFGMHDRTKFIVECFPLKRDLHSNDLRSNITRSCDVFFEWHFKNEGGEPPPTYDEYELGSLVNGRGANILVDVTGLSGSHATAMLALQPAPITVTWLEYPGSLGSKMGIAALATDRVASPPEYQVLYAEKLLVLPAPYLPNDYRQTVPEPRQSRARLEGRPVFCATHYPWKISAGVFSVWMEVMRKVPLAILRMQQCDDDTRANLFAEAEIRGVDPGRLEISEKVLDYYIHMERMSECWVFFDAPKYNGHTSASDVLYGGVPVVTLAGELMVSRGGASLVMSALSDFEGDGMGGSDTVARNEEEYHDLIIRLASNKSRIERVRDRMRERRGSASLFHTQKWVCNWERGLRMLYQVFPRAERVAEAMHVLPVSGCDS